MAKRKKKKFTAKSIETVASVAQVENVETAPIKPEATAQIKPLEQAEPEQPEPVAKLEPVTEFKLTFEDFKHAAPAEIAEPIAIAEPVEVEEPAEHVKAVAALEPVKPIKPDAKIELAAHANPAQKSNLKLGIRNEELQGEPAPFTCPDISVIIPMYNAENYIAACLDSILAQTFKNYELIVVDDCSTDRSPKIVRSYIPKFGGRLNHFRLKQNTGGAGIPRNKGITLARGEYIMFIDSDDMITPTALEENLKLARQYNSDVLYRTLYYKLSEDGSKRELAHVPKYKQGDKTVIDNDLESRVNDMVQSLYWLAPWRTFSKREFLLEHELFFPNIRPYEDLVWTHALLFYTKNFLRVPHPIYLYRDNEGSMTRVKKTPAESAQFYLNPVILGLKSLDEYMQRHPFFEDKPKYHYGILENFFNGRFTSVFREEASELKPHELYEAIRDGFGDKLGDYDVLVAALCTALHTQQEITATKLKNLKKYVVESKSEIAALENRLAKLKAAKA